MREGFKEKLFAAAKEKGFTDYELYYTGGSDFSVKVFEGEIREYKHSGQKGLSFRGTWNGKMGYAFTERIAEEIIPFLIENAAQNAEIIEDPDGEDLYKGAEEYPTVKTYDESSAAVTAEDKIAKAFSMEKAALGYNPQVEALDYCQLGTGEKERYIANSLGLTVSDRTNLAYAYMFPRVRGTDGQVKTNGEIWVGKGFSGFDPEEFGVIASKKALSYLGAKSVPTGSYRILFNGNAMSSLLRAFSGVFNADNVQKGFSLLKGKVGEQIGSDLLTIRDDPLLDNLPGSAGFDSEGIPGKNKVIVEKGILKTFLHNRKTAKKDGAVPTGNGFKPSFRASVGISPTNLYILPSDASQDALLMLMGKGLLISDLEGLHSGANPVSGDFSVSAEGHTVENGRTTHAVEQITIAGNFFTVLQNIRAIGNDIAFKGSISSPSVLVKELSVAGN